ncbi:hypothetical protein PIB30_048245 [Stylosanthes scabra]|uniref:O-methyltransferase dimerisation domain-containing protein n=1 Tax=Stylosanthes scabra TaxID=79078 RepID=A0ABU6XIA2_9FABA|nr:hypothetical protein [Stylosanthes scabra]
MALESDLDAKLIDDERLNLPQVEKQEDEKEGGFLFADIVWSNVINMALKTTIELGVFDIIVKAGEDAKLSAKDIADKIGTNNPEAPTMLDRLLRLLASHSLLCCCVVEDPQNSNLHQRLSQKDLNYPQLYKQGASPPQDYSPPQQPLLDYNSRPRRRVCHRRHTFLSQTSYLDPLLKSFGQSLRIRPQHWRRLWGHSETEEQEAQASEIDQRNNTIQQLEAALRELLERQTREAALASKAVKRAEELTRKQQAILDEAEKREKDRLEKLEKLNSKTQTAADHNSKTAESKDRTWRPSTVITRAPGKKGTSTHSQLTSWRKKSPRSSDTPWKSNPQFLNEVSQVERVPAPRPIKNTSRGDRRSYCKYHKQHRHDTEECRDLLDFIEEGLKNGRFREYTSRNRNKDDERRVRQRQNSPETKAERRRDEPKERNAHREIAMISGGIPDEGNPPSKKVAKRNKHSCLAVEVMPIP